MMGARWTASLFIDDVPVGETPSGTPTTFSTATLICGQGSGSYVYACKAWWDEIKIVKGFTNLLSDSSFENRSITGPARYYNTGSWKYYSLNPNYPVWDASNFHDGTTSCLINIAESYSGGAFIYQDFSINYTDQFILDFWAYFEYINLTANGGQQCFLSFDWDRGVGNSRGSAGLAFVADQIIFYAWGQTLTISMTSLNTWHHYRFELTAESSGWAGRSANMGGAWS